MLQSYFYKLAFTILGGAIIALAVALQAFAQTSLTTRYVYDSNGRLRAVLSPNGEAAVYDYDPAGNITAIRRLAVGACEVLEFTPQQGTPGALVTIYGVGFGGQVSGVSFNGITAQIVSQTPISVVARVPDQATTGPITVTLPCGTKTFAAAFTVSGVQVTPATITLFPGRGLQFIAAVRGLPDPAIEWSVNSLKGGSTAAGFISATGFYVAPELPANMSAVQVILRASSVTDRSVFGEAQVKVTSIGYEFLAQGVAVRYGEPPRNGKVYTAASAVAVRYGEPAKNGSVYVAGGPVSARFAPPPVRGLAATYNSVSVTRGASVAAISTEKLHVGQTVTLTINGANLTGITLIRLTGEDGSEDANLTVTNLKTEADGTQLTVTVIAAARANPGLRTIRLFTADGVPLPSTATLEIVP